MSESPLLRVEDLALHYRTRRGTVRAVDGVSFEVGRGEALVVLGESGCGKSSLAKLLMRVLPRNVEHTGGRVTLGGIEVSALSDERFRREVQWSRMALVMQASMNALNPVVRVGDQVAEPMRVLHHWSRPKALSRAADVFEWVGISTDFLARYPFELSGGMRQRAVLAMALIAEPELVILDEPTSALDVLTQAGIMNTLKRIKREQGTSFLLITHDVATSSEIADRVALMDAGQVVEVADAGRFFTAPSHPRSRRLMESVPRLYPQERRAPPLQAAPRPSGEPLLAVDDLHTWFELRQWGFLRVGAVRAVDGITLSLAPGEAVAFVGESGCGKSSLARTLLGLHRPTRGEVHFEASSLGALDTRELKAYRARVGYVQQDPYGALPPFMDVRRLLAEPLIVHGVTDRAERERRIRAALEEVRLSPVEAYLEKFPHMLSGGQQQRVVIARALILAPALVIADEPVSMLDASVRVEILELLRRIQRSRELTLAFVTHDLSTVRHYAERIFVMYAGRVVESAPVDELLDHPQHPYTRALLAAIADPDAANAERLREVPAGEPPSLLDPPAACRFHPRCPHVMDGLCNVDDPPDFEPRSGHLSACWLHC